MKQKTFLVRNDLGFPARAAAALVHIANTSGSEVRVEKDGETRDGRSILDVLSLMVSHGSELTVSVAGEDEDSVMQQIADLMESGW